jgi:hypothetical protein
MKYTESDIVDGLKLIRVGISNIMFNIAKGEIDYYVLKTINNINLVCNVIVDYIPEIDLEYSLNRVDYYRVWYESAWHSITVEEGGDCLLFKINNEYERS